jgi:hypothetical protein
MTVAHCQCRRSANAQEVLVATAETTSSKSPKRPLGGKIVNLGGVIRHNKKWCG